MPANRSWWWVACALFLLGSACSGSGAGSTCGDGVTTGSEVCDDGNAVSEASCPYGTPSCTACAADCSAALALAGAFCGDGVTNGSEVCDDGNAVGEASCSPGVATCRACAAACDRELDLVGPILERASGDGQVGAAGGPLAQPLRVRVVRGGDAVPGVTVRWTIAAGAGALSAAEAVTDASGAAEVIWTLGTVAGAPQRATAEAVGFVGPPLAFTASAVAGPPARLVFLVQPASTMSTAVLSVAPEVAVLDAYGNLAVGTAPVTLTLASNPAGGTLSGESVVMPAGGIAAFPGLSLDRVGTGYRLAAQAPGLAAESSDPFDVTVHLAVVAQPSETIAGEPIAPAMEVRATDAGAPVADVALSASLAEGGALEGETAGTTDASGVASFAALVVPQRGAATRLVVIAAGAPSSTVTSAPFDVLAVDQQQPVLDRTGAVHMLGGSSEQKLAQVVTVGAAGALVAVRLPVACGAGTELTVRIQGVRDGAPDAAVLAAEAVPATQLPGFAPTLRDFALVRFETPPSFAAGDRLAIVLETAGACGVDLGPSGDPYLGGDGFFDARPNLPGWVPLSLGDARHDLPFQILLR